MRGIHREGIEKIVFAGFLMIVAAVEAIKMGLIIMLLPSLFENLHYSQTVLGWVLSSNLLADNICKSATGWFVDREGPWPVLIIGTLTVFAGLVLLTRYHQNAFLIITGSALIGMGGSPTWPAAIAGSIRIKGETTRAATLSKISVMWLVGGGSGIFLVGVFITAHSGLIQKLPLVIKNPYSDAFLMLLAISAATVLISFCGWFLWPKAIADGSGRKEFTGDRQRLKAVWRQVILVWKLIPGMFFQTFSFGLLLPNLLPFVLNTLGLTEMQYYLLLLVGGAVVVAFMHPVGRMIDRRGARGFLVSGFVLAPAALLGLLAFGNTWNIWGIGILLGFSYALIQPAWNSVLAASIPPEQRGVLMGLFMSIEGLGFALGPGFGGWLSEIHLGGWLGQFGTRLPFLISAICLLIMAIVYIFHPFYHFSTEE